jgi:hypothetical protein
MKRVPALALVLVALAGVVSAQCGGTVPTILTGGNGQSGTMFDIVNTSGSPVVVTSFDQSWFTAGSSDMEIRTKTGSYAGFDTNPGAWTLIGSAAAVAHPTTNVYVPVPIAVAVVIPPASTQAFYITSTLVGTGNTVAYTTGVNQINTVIGSDAFIQIKAGVGVAYPFAGTFGLPTAGRLWNGRVTYTCGGSPTYQVNSGAASFDANGLQSNGFAPAATTLCQGAPLTLNLGGLIGNGYEIVVSNAALVPAGGGAVVTGNGQIVNVNLADPSTGFLWGLTFPPFPVPLGLTVPLAMPGIPLIAAQLAILDGSHPDGFRLSQAIQLNGIPSSQTASGPAGDDIAMTINAGSVYTDGACGSFVAPALPLYGVVRTTYHVITNGRITWPTSDTSYTPTVAAAQTGVGFVGCWSDLNTATAGNITLSLVGNAFVASWNGVGYFGGTAGNVNTFSIAIDSVTGVVTITGTTAIAVQAGLNMFIGASPGSGATDPGMAAFGPAGAGAATLTTDMIYRFGATGPGLAAGANTIVLTPDGLGNYTWASS